MKKWSKRIGVVMLCLCFLAFGYSVNAEAEGTVVFDSQIGGYTGTFILSERGEYQIDVWGGAVVIQEADVQEDVGMAVLEDTFL